MSKHLFGLIWYDFTFGINHVTGHKTPISQAESRHMCHIISQSGYQRMVTGVVVYGVVSLVINVVSAPCQCLYASVHRLTQGAALGESSALCAWLWWARAGPGTRDIQDHTTTHVPHHWSLDPQWINDDPYILTFICGDIHLNASLSLLH